MEYPTLNPYITVDDAAKAIDFYQKSFGAEERFRLDDPSTGKIGHAELSLNGALLMLADEHPAYNKSPKTLGGTTSKLSLMVDDVDATYKSALECGAESIMPPTDMFYGFRNGCIRDPFGHEWMIQKKIKDVSPEEMKKSWAEMATNCDQNA